ncbi:putative cytochrome P450 [Helianthus debilis subsp. tardiflorus]
METWFLILASLCLAIIITSLMFHKGDSKKLPPGPSFFSSHLLLLTNSLPDLQSTIRGLKSKYGPLVTLSIVSHPSVFIGSHSLAHQVLIPKGNTSSDRPKFFPLHGISTASYGPNWRAFRHNLASGFLSGSHVKSYSWARKWALQRLIGQLQVQQEGVGTIKVIDHIHLAMFRLSVLMCFGEKLDDHRVNDIASINGGLLSLVDSMMFNVIFVSPLLAKILFGNKWKKLDKLRSDQNQLLIPLIKSRKEAADTERNVAYIDTLLKLQLPEDDRKLTETEMVSMCGEFLLAATEATSNALQWIMANLVKHPIIQSKLYDEIVAVVGPPPPPGARGVELESGITEENLKKIPYLKAVVLEGLRRHPPAHLVLPHRVTEQVELQGYKIPKGATINFMVAEMGWDPEVWEEPMEFKPERFLVNDGVVFDIGGSKGIKMMPFGAGRRICPGADLALLHLEYFVANLIWYFHWSVADGYRVDLTEKVRFTVVMKNPLQAKISSRTKMITT